ncbi:hypothetical protein [Nocardioides bruguierae]|uniref:Uncharacterized protein n=1 Tax=Nocardioides bruguierae TaxID=2945102 RepID=A0A9X2D4P9_9ACTN|nr:hypothetical protein [Nocardioides bruguierae]MCM0618782.1 hypothetical protein [Nocardioides bruguierae]
MTSDSPCSTFSWCELGAEEHQLHVGGSDVEEIPGMRTALRSWDDGPAWVELEAAPSTSVHRLSLHEADLLRRHMTQLLRDAGHASEEAGL